MRRRDGARKRSNVEKKGIVARKLQYVVYNWEKVTRDNRWEFVRRIAESLYLTAPGVRLLHDGHEMISAFEELTIWYDLLTPEQKFRSREMLETLASRKDFYMGMCGKSVPGAVLRIPPVRDVRPEVVPEGDSNFSTTAVSSGSGLGPVGGGQTFQELDSVRERDEIQKGEGRALALWCEGSGKEMNVMKIKKGHGLDFAGLGTGVEIEPSDRRKVVEQEGERDRYTGNPCGQDVGVLSSRVSQSFLLPQC